MKKPIAALAASSIIAVSACANLTPEQKNDVGVATIGAVAAGATAAVLFQANAGWTVAAALAGAAAGVLIASNSRTGQCAYADGKGGYVTRPCR